METSFSKENFEEGDVVENVRLYVNMDSASEDWKIGRRIEYISQHK